MLSSEAEALHQSISKPYLPKPQLLTPTPGPKPAYAAEAQLAISPGFADHGLAAGEFLRPSLLLSGR